MNDYIVKEREVVIDLLIKQLELAKNTLEYYANRHVCEERIGHGIAKETLMKMDNIK